MDKLSQFVINTYSAKPAAKTAAAIHPVEPTAIEKRAYSRALDSIGQDADFLAKFEGTPLAPNAVALAEQELAMEQRRLQRRVQRMATQQSDNWEQDSVEEDTLRIQKQQLLLQLYKMKATTPAPQPGDAVIGQPAPTQLGSEIGGGDTGSFPVQEPTPKLSALISKLAAMPSLADVMREPTAYRGKVDPSHLTEMGGNPFLPHPARRAILDEYLKGRAAASQVAAPDELLRDHAADAKMTNQFGGAALGAFAGPIVGGALGTAAAHLAKSRDLAPGMVLGAALGVPAGALVGGYLGGKRAITPMTPDEAQRHIQDAHLHREMYAPLAADEAAKEHLLHQLTAKHYEDALQRARAEQYDDFEEDDEPSYRRSRSYAAKTAAIQDFARGLRKSAGIADREYMRGPREAVKNISPMTALRYGIPGAFGAVHGAEQVPENRLVGALGGAAGGIGGSELGGMTGRAIHNSTIGELIGRTLGAGAGQDLGARAARLMVT
jgi:hypothetical protein